MKITDFTAEELNFIGAVHGNTREETMDNILEIISDISEADVKATAETVLHKLSDTTNDEFAEFGFDKQTVDDDMEDA